MNRKLVFMGNWGIGQVALRAASSVEGWESVAVFTREFDAESDDPWRNATWNQAAKREIPRYSPDNIHSACSLKRLRELAPDLLLVAAFPRLLGPEVLAVPRLGALNLHGSLLPRNRGVSPINWALIRDEPDVGLTMHYIDEGMDSGDVVFQERVPVEREDSPATLADKIKALAPSMVRRALTSLATGEPLPRVGQDPGKATFAPRLTEDACRIDWTADARQVWSLVRGACQPGFGAWSMLDDRPVVITKCRVGDAAVSSASPGTVISIVRMHAVIACGRGSVEIPLDHLRPRGGGGPCVPRVGDVFEVTSCAPAH